MQSVALENIDPSGVEESSPLVYSSESVSGRPHSSGLYATEPWVPADAHDVAARLADMADPPLKLKLAEEVAAAVSKAILGFVESEGIDTEDMTVELHEAVASALSDLPIEIFTRVKLIASDPSSRAMSGNTTDGLHFDVEQPHHPYRLGLNLGPIPRWVYFVPRDRASFKIAGPRVSESEYRRIAESEGARAWRFRVEPGDGWLMSTERYLHDGRRAVAEGKSLFALLEASPR